MRITLRKGLCTAGNELSTPIKQNKGLFIVALCCTIAGIAVGIAIGLANKNSDYLCFLTEILQGKYVPFRYLFSFLFLGILVCGIAITGFFLKPSLLYPAVALVFSAIKLAQSATLAISVNKFSGFFCVIIFYLPVFLVLQYVLFLVFAKIKEYGVCKISCFCSQSVGNVVVYAVKLLVWYALVLFVLFVILGGLFYLILGAI